MTIKRDKDQYVTYSILFFYSHLCFFLYLFDLIRYTKYTITSLEKLWKPKIFAEPDLGIPLDLLDLSVYKYDLSLSLKNLRLLQFLIVLARFRPPKVRQPLAPEDEELLRDDDAVTPIKKDGIKRKERPTDKGVSWLVKTQYISSINNESTRQVYQSLLVLGNILLCFFSVKTV